MTAGFGFGDSETNSKTPPAQGGARTHDAQYGTPAKFKREQQVPDVPVKPDRHVPPPRPLPEKGRARKLRAAHLYNEMIGHLPNRQSWNALLGPRGRFAAGHNMEDANRLLQSLNDLERRCGRALDEYHVQSYAGLPMESVVHAVATACAGDRQAAEAVAGLRCLADLNLVESIRTGTDALPENHGHSEAQVRCAWRIAQELEKTDVGRTVLRHAAAWPVHAPGIHASVQAEEETMVRVYLRATGEQRKRAEGAQPPPRSAATGAGPGRSPQPTPRQEQAARRVQVVEPARAAAAAPPQAQDAPAAAGPDVLADAVLQARRHLAQAHAHANDPQRRGTPFAYRQAEGVADRAGFVRAREPELAVGAILNGLYDVGPAPDGSPSKWQAVDGMMADHHRMARIATQFDGKSPARKRAAAFFTPWRYKSPYNAFDRISNGGYFNQLGRRFYSKEAHDLTHSASSAMKNGRLMNVHMLGNLEKALRLTVDHWLTQGAQDREEGRLVPDARRDEVLMENLLRLELIRQMREVKPPSAMLQGVHLTEQARRDAVAAVATRMAAHVARPRQHWENALQDPALQFRRELDRPLHAGTIVGWASAYGGRYLALKTALKDAQHAAESARQRQRDAQAAVDGARRTLDAPGTGAAAPGRHARAANEALQIADFKLRTANTELLDCLGRLHAVERDLERERRDAGWKAGAPRSLEEAQAYGERALEALGALRDAEAQSVSACGVRDKAREHLQAAQDRRDADAAANRLAHLMEAGSGPGHAQGRRQERQETAREQAVSAAAEALARAETRAQQAEAGLERARARWREDFGGDPAPGEPDWNAFNMTAHQITTGRRLGVKMPVLRNMGKAYEQGKLGDKTPVAVLAEKLEEVVQNHELGSRLEITSGRAIGGNLDRGNFGIALLMGLVARPQLNAGYLRRDVKGLDVRTDAAGALVTLYDSTSHEGRLAGGAVVGPGIEVNGKIMGANSYLIGGGGYAKERITGARIGFNRPSLIPGDAARALQLGAVTRRIIDPDTGNRQAPLIKAPEAYGDSPVADLLQQYGSEGLSIGLMRSVETRKRGGATLGALVGVGEMPQPGTVPTPAVSFFSPALAADHVRRRRLARDEAARSSSTRTDKGSRTGMSARAGAGTQTFSHRTQADEQHLALGHSFTEGVFGTYEFFKRTHNTNVILNVVDGKVSPKSRITKNFSTLADFKKYIGPMLGDYAVDKAAVQRPQQLASDDIAVRKSVVEVNRDAVRNAIRQWEDDGWTANDSVQVYSELTREAHAAARNLVDARTLAVERGDMDQAAAYQALLDRLLTEDTSWAGCWIQKVNTHEARSSPVINFFGVHGRMHDIVKSRFAAMF